MRRKPQLQLQRDPSLVISKPVLDPFRPKGPRLGSKLRGTHHPLFEAPISLAHVRQQSGESGLTAE